MIEREIAPRLKTLFDQYPFVTVTGPRQSGKTTLCRSTFPDLQYANLELPDQRAFAEADPRSFLSQLKAGAIIDEIQRVPDLLSYLQVIADEDGGNGLFVLTGSEQFSLSNAIGQSLAGRTALLRLLPFSLSERRRTGGSIEINDMLFSGFYPRILDRNLEPRQALADYFETYIERDVRRLGGVSDLSSFGHFMRLCAGRVGQLVNLSSLGADAGITHPTAKQWLTILERSYIVFQLPPFHANLRKRLTRSPKLYFYDVGLAAYLLGIENPAQMATHHMRGSLFENLVVTEALKHRFNRGHGANLSFYRDKGNLECDLLYTTGQGIAAIEVKSGATVASDFFTSLNRVAALVPDVSSKAVVYGGTERQSRTDCDVVPVEQFTGFLERLEADLTVSSFIQDHIAPEPDRTDINILDNVLLQVVRPLLHELDSACRAVGEALFRQYQGQSSVKAGTSGVRGSDILKAQSWPRVKANYVVGPGFELSDERPIEISHDLSFTDYTGKGSSSFNVVLNVTWVLTGTAVSRVVSVDGAPLSHLGHTIPYSELDKWPGDVDTVTADLLKGVIGSIAAHVNEQV